jgi:hypothetical protein
MKTQISRNSFRPGQRYSGVYQQQGRMVLDADVNEQSDISKTRLNAALDDVIGSGVPAAGGLEIVSDGSGGIEIVPGRVYVDGIPAEVRPLDGSATVPYEQQSDFPSPPPVPSGIESPPASPPAGAAYSVYVDVWERTVLPLEDSALLDPGLHGADTCTRTRTMAQIKWCPAGQNPEENTFNPRIGNGPLTLSLREGATSPDPCDPCAEEIDLESHAGNYLFRLEVHGLGRDADGNRTLTLKWSSENGAEQYDVGNVPVDFTSGDWVYEFFDATTETHLGWHLAGAPGFPERGPLSTAFSPTPAAYPWVRRWDGYCVLVRAGGLWALARDAEGAAVGVDRGVPLRQTGDPVSRLGDVHVDDELTMNLDRLLLRLGLRESGFDRVFVPGDFWLAPVREHDDGSAPLLDRSPPDGIEHHYMLLADVDGNLVTQPEGGVCNRYAFPPLTHLTAAGICFENTCPDLYGADADNVQDALDNLCNALDAEDIPLDKDDPDLCAQLQPEEVISVQDALNVLCRSESAGGGCAQTVGEGGTFATLDEAVVALQQAPVVALCLLPGDHVLSQAFGNGPFTTIRITGSGLGACRVVLRGNYDLRAAEVSLERLAVVARPDRGLSIDAQRIDVNGCGFERLDASERGRPLVQIGGADGVELHWHDSTVLATTRSQRDDVQVIVPGPEVLPVRSRARRDLNAFLAVDPGLQPRAYAEALSVVTTMIMELSAEQRALWARERSAERLASLSLERSSYLVMAARAEGDAKPGLGTELAVALSRVSPRNAAEGFYRMLARGRLTAAVARSALDDLGRAGTRSGFATGLALQDNRVGGTIGASSFAAEVLFNAGTARGTALVPGMFPGDELPDPVQPGGSLRLTGNGFQRIRTLVPSGALDDSGRLAKPVPGYRSTFLSDNSFAAEENGFASLVFNMQASHFAASEPEGTLAALLGSFGAFTANWSPVPALIRTSIFANDRKTSSGNIQIAVD